MKKKWKITYIVEDEEVPYPLKNDTISPLLTKKEVKDIVGDGDASYFNVRSCKVEEYKKI